MNYKLSLQMRTQQCATANPSVQSLCSLFSFLRDRGVTEVIHGNSHCVSEPVTR